LTGCKTLLHAIISHSQKFCLMLPFWLVAFPQQARPFEETIPEANLQAAFVYNFTQFIKWPDTQANTIFPLCILGSKDDAKKFFNELNGKTANHQVIEVIYLSSVLSMTNIQGCQLIFQLEAFPKTLTQPLAQGVVLVSYNPLPGTENICIALQLNRERKLRFAINPAAVAVAGVVVSSQLQKLAIEWQELGQP